MLSFFSRGVLNEILNLIESVSEVFSSYSCTNPLLVTTFPSGSAVQNHGRTHPVSCVRPYCVYSVLRAHVQFCQFDKADATANIH